MLNIVRKDGDTVSEIDIDRDGERSMMVANSL